LEKVEVHNVCPCSGAMPNDDTVALCCVSYGHDAGAGLKEVSSSVVGDELWALQGRSKSS